jgi:hypothetical protein
VQPHVPCAFSSGLYPQGRPLHPKSWSSAVGVSGFGVTIDSFEGRIIQGSFSGSLPAVPFRGDGTTITLEGPFRGPIRQ